MKQTLILMKGHPATGKSTLARELARSLQIPLLDKDDVKDFTLDLPDGNVLAYEITWRQTRRILDLGLSVIVDTPLSYPIGYETGRRLAEWVEARLIVIETVPPEPVWRSRLDARQGETHRISGWAAMQRLLAEYGGCWQYAIDPKHLVRVDTARPTTELLEKLCGLITT